jgi:hypothetical protein
MDDDLDSLSPPDRRKHGYAELEQQIEEHKEEVTHDLNLFKELTKQELEKFYAEIRQVLRRFFFRALVVCAIIGLTSAVGILGFGLVLRKQSNLTEDIQGQRYEVTYNTCKDQNDRHDDTIALLDQLAKKAVKRASPEERKQIAQSIASSKLLIDALAPRISDCTALAKSRVKGPR